MTGPAIPPLPSLPRRVLMTADAVGGVWDYALELAGGLAPLGVSVTLAVMGGGMDGTRRARALAIPGLDLREGPFKLEWMAEPEADLEAAGSWLLQLAAESGAGLVHLNGYAHAALPWPVPVLVVGHSCVLSWWQAVHKAPPPRKDWAGYEARVRAGLAAADAVAAPTAAMLRALETHYGRLRDALVISNGRDPRGWRPAAKEPLILGVGRLWDEAKNAAALAAVAPALPWPVALAGDWRRPGTDDGNGGDRPPDGVRALGPLPPSDLAGWYGRAAIFCSPARYEPFGLAALEAGLSGCALVLGDIPSLREVWGDAALFVPPDDRAALAEALTALCGDGGRRTALGRAARRRALTYGAARMARETAALYGRLCAGQRQDRPSLSHALAG